MQRELDLGLAIPRQSQSNYGRRLVEHGGLASMRTVRSALSFRAISDGMSPEAQLAMRQVLEENRPKTSHPAMIASDAMSTSSRTTTTTSSLRTGSRDGAGRKKKVKHATFSEVCEEKVYSIHDDDIAYPVYSLPGQGHAENVVHEATSSQDSQLDETAIDTIAKRNSVEKCAVWVHTHDVADSDVIGTSEGPE